MEYLVNASTRHQVLMQRFASGEASRSVKSLRRLEGIIRDRILTEPRLTNVLSEIEGLIKGYKFVNKKNIHDFAVQESKFSVNIYNKASTDVFSLPSSDSIIKSVDNELMVPIEGVQGAVNLDDAIKDFGNKKANDVTQIIRDGIVIGDTNEKISRSVGSVMRTLHKRQLRALVKTATNHASSVSRLETYKQNDQFIKGYTWISTLDNSTTLICGSRDRVNYIIGIGPMPPAHWSCRSTTIPRIKNKAKNLPEGTRPSVGGDGVKIVSSKVSYGGWLRRQPKNFIDEALGVERSKLFRNNKLKIDKFLDPTGREYTLSELRAVNNLAI